jgi:hypothetical protein
MEHQQGMNAFKRWNFDSKTESLVNLNPYRSPWQGTNDTSTTLPQRRNLPALWDLWLVATIHLLATGRSKGSMRTVLANTRAKHISVQEGAKAIASKTHTTPANQGNRIKNTVLGIAMTPRYQKRFDKS